MRTIVPRNLNALLAASFFGIYALSFPGAAQAQMLACEATPTTGANTTLTTLSDIWFGDGSYKYAIMLATNSRSGQDGISFIGNPDALESGAKVCIPQAAEADRLRRRYERYVEAVADMSVAQPWEMTNALTPLPQTGTYRVATWIRADQQNRYPSAPSSDFNYPLGGDTWVTLEPKLKNFCTDFVNAVSSDPAALTLRLEQRLGLPLVSSKTHFAVFEIDASSPNSGKKLFRPCGDTSTATTSCPVGINGDNLFLYRQYYQSYGTTLPVQYPWTSLGYTFDWAPDPNVLGRRDSYVRIGESEYVAPKGTMVKFVGVVPTAKYCSR
jgi:hypothetical protein